MSWRAFPSHDGVDRRRGRVLVNVGADVVRRRRARCCAVVGQHTPLPPVKSVTIMLQLAKLGVEKIQGVRERHGGLLHIVAPLAAVETRAVEGCDCVAISLGHEGRPRNWLVGAERAVDGEISLPVVGVEWPGVAQGRRSVWIGRRGVHDDVVAGVIGEVVAGTVMRRLL